MKNLINPLLIATALIATACTNATDIDNHDVDPSGKTPISFVGENSSAPVTRAGFTEKTQVAMHIRSKKDKNNIKETRVLANALKDAAPGDNTFSKFDSPSKENIRYWDDAYGRSANISVFAVAVPGKSDVKNGIDPTNKEGVALIDHLASSTGWNTGSLSEKIDWFVSTDQSKGDSIAIEDLTYSNNISAKGSGGAMSYNYEDDDYTKVNNGELAFRLKDSTQPDGPGKFDQGRLVFNHALCRITLNIIKGAGYKDDGSDFKFKDGTNVTIINVPVAGKLDLENGSWDDNTTKKNITKMATTDLETDAEYSLLAQILPGYVINKDNDTDVLSFVIDDSKYYVTQGMMFEALNGKKGISESANTGTTITMEQGRNYVFNLTVDKSKVSVTATLAKWTDVEADKNVNNGRTLGFTMFTTNGDPCKSFDMYRMNDASTEGNKWAGNYKDQATLSSNNSIWNTGWYYENNLSFYHFRSVNKGIKLYGDDDDNVDDYFEIESGDQKKHDYIWGAPLLYDEAKNGIAYSSSDGYGNYISKAIGANNSAISMTAFHMMSNLSVELRTTTGNNKVELEKGDKQCEVSLTYFYNKGTVKLGNGLVNTTGGLKESDTFTKPDKGTSADGTEYTKTGLFTYAVVPQSLVRTGEGSNLYVGFTIKTPDDNVYYVVKELSSITATSNGNSLNQGTSAIALWYPNHSYKYTFTLTKSGIDNVTCTVSKWIDIMASSNVSLE